MLPRLLAGAECEAAAALWSDDGAFRKRIDMRRHRYGEGEYRYFAAPLPPLVATLREGLYPPLAQVANRWQEALREDARFEPTLAGWLRRCHAAGQTKPTPLLLRYEKDGFNCLHQDLYGELAFPIQATVLLSEPGRDFEGGEFLLVEQRPRQQSRGEAVVLRRGDAILFANAVRPGPGARGPVRWAVRHGVSTVRAGLRMTLGLIFHDAR